MAELHPSLPDAHSFGQHREIQMLLLLANSLPAAFLIFHGLHWSSIHEGSQRYGEFDVVVLAPTGHLVVFEIKAGSVDISELGVFKRYGGTEKNVASQAHAQLHALIGRLRKEGLGAARVNHYLLLPDFQVAHGTVGYPRERIIDAGQLGRIPDIAMELMALPALEHGHLERLHGFLSNRFELVPDAACRVGQQQEITRRLSAGLATWLPRISSAAGIYIVEATAGSGKTQLALQLLQTAASRGERAAYVCFNRPLADHIGRLAPVRAEVATVHELGIAALRASGIEPDFKGEGTFQAGMDAMAAANERLDGVLDLLIVDESQDFDVAWLQALLLQLKKDGRLYMLGDVQQAVYPKEEGFDLPDAVRVVCHDNFRSPRKIVEAINAFRLTREAVVALSQERGEAPGLHAHDASDTGGLQLAGRLVRTLLRRGYRREDIAVLSFQGRERSRLLSADALGDLALHRFTGEFDNARNPCWTAGELLAESVYRFKGQSAPVVIVCEMDFEEVDDKVRRKLFVAMTRAQQEVHLVLSARAEQALVNRLESADAA